jgi:GTP-binding protein HflX
VLVLAKADRVGEERRLELERRHPDGILVSARTGEGLVGLIERIEEEFALTLQEVELLIPYEEGSRVAELHAIAGDLEREDTPAGVRVVAKLPPAAAARYGAFTLSRRAR